MSCAPRSWYSRKGPPAQRPPSWLWAGPLASRYTGAFPGAPGASPSPRLLAQASQFGPGGVEVAFGALGPGAQLTA